MLRARAVASSELIDTLPLPDSTSARNRSLRPESDASALRVMPRRARQARTRAPSSPRVALDSVARESCSGMWIKKHLEVKTDSGSGWPRLLPGAGKTPAFAVCISVDLQYTSALFDVKQFIASFSGDLLMKLKILVGTMTSTADYVAQAIQMDCADLVS